LDLDTKVRRAWIKEHQCPNALNAYLGSGNLCSKHAIEYLIHHPEDMRIQDITAILSILLARVDHLEQQVDTLQSELRDVKASR
jgi:hypothetical protein